MSRKARRMPSQGIGPPLFDDDMARILRRMITLVPRSVYINPGKAEIGMARKPQDRKPTAREEIYLVWLFLHNVEQIRRNRNRFNKMFGMQKRIRQLLGWSFEETTDAEMVEYLEKAVERLKERFAFDAEGIEMDDDEDLDAYMMRDV